MLEVSAEQWLFGEQTSRLHQQVLESERAGFESTLPMCIYGLVDKGSDGRVDRLSPLCKGGTNCAGEDFGQFRISDLAGFRLVGCPALKGYGTRAKVEERQQISLVAFGVETPVSKKCVRSNQSFLQTIRSFHRGIGYPS